MRPVTWHKGPEAQTSVYTLQAGRSVSPQAHAPLQCCSSATPHPHIQLPSPFVSAGAGGPTWMRLHSKGHFSGVNVEVLSNLHGATKKAEAHYVLRAPPQARPSLQRAQLSGPRYAWPSAGCSHPLQARRISHKMPCRVLRSKLHIDFLYPVCHTFYCRFCGSSVSLLLARRLRLCLLPPHRLCLLLRRCSISSLGLLRIRGCQRRAVLPDLPGTARLCCQEQQAMN